MLGKQEKGTINIKCTEPALPEFPNLLFGKQIETGTSYFDATAYLSSIEDPKSIKDFFSQYRPQLRALQNAYGIDELYKINPEGHYIIDANFVCLFISFVEPNFLAYICDRMHELLSDGISVSDTYLLQAAHNRLSKEVLETIMENGKQNPEQ